MAKKSNLVNETIMYSINRETMMVVKHHLPFSRTDPVSGAQLQHYIDKGFVFEMPISPQEVEKVAVESDEVAVPEDSGHLNCFECSFVARSEGGLKTHQRWHQKWQWPRKHLGESK